MKHHAPGMVGVIAQESARFSQFGKDLTSLVMTFGSEIRWRFGWDLADAHNALIEEMLANPSWQWLWLMADDHAFSPGILLRLLDHDVDLVVPVCLMRNPPYRPVNWVFTEERHCSNCGHVLGAHQESGGCVAGHPEPLGTGYPADTPCLCIGRGEFFQDSVERINLDDHPDGGLVELAYSGAAGLLIRRHVLETMKPPWFETGTGITNRVGEDINFCRKAREAGFHIYCDLDTVLGHLSTTAVWPVREQDGWTFAFSMMGGFKVTLPPGFQAYADECGR